MSLLSIFGALLSSISLNDDYIHLRLFQLTLIGVTTKWYIELPEGYINFNHMVLVFLNHFQFLFHYDVIIELMFSFLQEKATHILDHIQ
jgi:hypothetical protein